MGELIFAIFIGGWTFSVGLFMYVYLSREEKREIQKRETLN